MAERLKAPHSKRGIRKRIKGSNPFPTATKRCKPKTNREGVTSTGATLKGPREDAL